MKNFSYVLFTLFIHLNLITIPVKAQDGSSKPQSHTLQQLKIDSVNKAALEIYTSNPAKARELAQNGLLLSKKNKYGLGIGESYLYIGKAYWAQSYYPISLFYYNTALPYLLKSADSLLLSDCYRSMGRNYSDLKKYDQALVFLNKALKQAGNRPLQKELSLSEMSNAYSKLKQYDKAKDYINSALKICREINSKVDIAILYSRLYSVYLGNGDLRKAAAYCDTAYQMSLNTNNNRLKTLCLVAMANIAYQQKKYFTAARWAKKSALMADSLGNLEVYSNASKLLYNIYDKTGDMDKALMYQNNYIKLQDSLNKVDKQNSIQLIEDYFSLNTKLHSIEQIEQRNQVNNVLIKSQKITIYNLGLTILLLFVAVFVLYSYYKQKNKLSKQLEARHLEAVEQNKLIETQTENLNELNRQKDRLLAIIGHDLKSPLANVRSIVDLFGSGDVTAGEVQSLMMAMDPVIKGAELTLSSLVEWAGSQVMGNYINVTAVPLLKVAEEMGHIFKHSLTQKNISLTIKIHANVQVLADENHLKTILRNLVSNAIKFTADDGSIAITVRRDGEKLLISVTDTGKGMTDEELSHLFSVQTHFSKSGTKGELGTGIGLLLSRQLVELNGGEIGATSVSGQGSTFYFTLKESITQVIYLTKETNSVKV